MSFGPHTLLQQAAWAHALLTFAVFAPSVVAALLRRYRVPARAPANAPIRVTALKPLRGIDPELELNLESFAALSVAYPVEVLLLVDTKDDAALPIARAVASRHSNVRVLIGNDKSCSNPKVGSLVFGLSASTQAPARGVHELLWLTDSNVKTSNEHLQAHIDTWWSLHAPGQRVLVHAPLSANGGTGLGAAFERTHLPTYNNTGAESALVVGLHAVVGKSILCSREDLDAVGGMRAFGQITGEDLQMGREFRKAGAVRCAPLATQQVLGQQTVMDFYRRQLRWATVRRKMTFFTFLVLEPFSYFALITLSAALGLMPWAAVGLLYSLKIIADASLIYAFAGNVRLLDLLLIPLKDIVVVAAWAAAFFQSNVLWRGRKLGVQGVDYRLASSHDVNSAKEPQ